MSAAPRSSPSPSASPSHRPFPPPPPPTRPHPIPTHSLDVPKAPALLGQFYGAAVQAGILSLDTLPSLLEGEYGVGPKRDFTAAALKLVAKKAGDAGMVAAVKAASIDLPEVLKADPEFDQDALPLADWAKVNGLVGLDLQEKVADA